MIILISLLTLLGVMSGCAINQSTKYEQVYPHVCSYHGHLTGSQTTQQVVMPCNIINEQTPKEVQ